jgi:ATP-binding cassette subfamily D (ALD) long-chain fatty acid import protein
MVILSKPLPPQTRKQILILLASALLLRSAFASGPQYILSKLKVAARRKRLSPQQLEQALQQIYVKAEDGSKTLLVPYEDAYISKV